MKKLVLASFNVALAFIFFSSAFAQTPPGNALNFDGANDYIEGSDALFPAGNAARTMEAWMRTTQNSTGSVVEYGTPATNNRSGMMLVSGRIYFVGENNDLQGNITLNDGRWHHIAVTHDGVTLKIYADGVLDVSQAKTLNTALTHFRIGMRGNAVAELFNGSIDEVRIWSIAKTQAQIRADMYNTVNPASANLVAYYNFDQGTAAGINTSQLTLSDQTSNGSNGSLNNFSLTGSTSNWVESYAMVVPTAVAATGAATAGFTANWNAPVTGTVESYLLDVSSNASFSSFVGAFNGFNVGLATSYPVTNLLTGNNYYYRVRANKASVAGQGGNSNTISVATTGTPSNISGLNFDGINDYVAVNTGTASVSGTFTVEAWVKPNDASANMSIISTRLPNEVSFDLQIYGGNQIHGDIGDGSGWITTSADATFDYSALQWMHIAYVVTPNDYTIYINGNQMATGPLYGYTPLLFDANHKFEIGRYYANNLQFNGTLDEVRTWNTARTQAEIRATMFCSLTAAQTGLVTSHTFNEGIANGYNVGLISTVNDYSGNGYNATINGFALNGSTSNFVNADLNGTATITANKNLSCGVTSAIFTASTSMAGSTLTYQWKKNGANVGTNSITYTDNTLSNGDTVKCIVTTSGSCLTSFTSNSLIIGSPLKLTATGPLSSCAGGNVTLMAANSNALNFSGSSQWVDLQNRINTLSQVSFTLEAWINTTGTYEGIIGCSNNNTSWEFGEKLLYVDGSGYIMFVGNNSGYLTSSTAVNDGKWHHIAATWAYSGSGSSGTGHIYIDGIDRTTSSGYAANIDAVGTFNIGRPNYGEAPYFFSGKMEEVRIWNVAQTQSQIQTNMWQTIPANSPGLQAYYKAVEGSGTTLTDYTGTNTGIINDPTWVNSALPVYDGVAYSWSTGATTASINVSYSTTTTYSVSVTSACGVHTDSLKVTINDPIITVQPLAVSVCTGANAAFSVSATGSPLTYQWQVSTGGAYSNITDGGIYAGATTGTLTLSGITQALHNYNYKCVITGTSCTATSNAANLTVKNANITAQPVSMLICSGNASFSVTASGNNLTYQWQENQGSGFADIVNGGIYSGATSSAIMLTAPPASMNGYTYKCVINGDCASTVSTNTVTMGVGAPTIAVQPANKSVCSGTGTTFSVSATGSSMTYQWKVSTNGGASFSNLSNTAPYTTVTTNTLTITNPTNTQNNYQYQCAVTNTCGSTVSNNSVLTVSPSPVITSVSPVRGNVGSTITLTGTGFSATAFNNTVLFGGVKATITSDTTTSLNVTVPAGASAYAPISITTATCALKGTGGYFMPTYSCGPTGAFTATGNFAAGVDYSSADIPLATTPVAPRFADIDGDGKPDMIIINAIDSTISIYRNTTAASDTINSSSFAAKKTFHTGLNPVAFDIGDLDSDGKLDIALTNQTTHISLFRNTSVAGSISFSTSVADLVIATGILNGIAIGDLNNDGKSDIAVSANGTFIAMFKNTSVGSALSFAAQQNLGVASGAMQSVYITDLNADNKADIICTNASTNIYFVRNINTGTGAIAFTTAITRTNGFRPKFVCFPDIDGDGKPDVVSGSFTTSFINIFRNTSPAAGAFTFGASANIATASIPTNGTVGDINGDGKNDMVISSATNKVSLFRNQAVSGTVAAASFAAKVDLAATATTSPIVSINDLNADGKPDLVIANAGTGTNSISVLRNKSVLASTTITASGSTALCPGDSVSLTATNTMASTYAWSDGGTNATIVSGISAATAKVKPTITTTYTATVKSAATLTDPLGCSAIATKVVSVNTAAVITMQPADQSAHSGGNVAYTVSATGGGTLTYKWQENTGSGFADIIDGGIYAGSTNDTLTLTGATSGMNGYTYRCVVTSSLCNILTNSNAATLTINALIATVSQTNVLCFGGNTGSATVTASGTPPYTYSWSPGGGTGATISGLTANTYNCTIGDNAGNTITKTVIITQPSAALSGTASATICNGSSYTFGTSTLTTTGTYTRHTTAANGCDSLITLTLNVKPNATANISSIICNGDSVQFGASYYKASGTFTQHLTAVNSCDSLITFTLTVRPAATANISASICAGDSIQFDTLYYKASGIYSRHLISAAGCDSLIILTLNVKPNSSANISGAICDGNSYTFGSFNLTTPGIYTRHVTSTNGCDSLITLTLNARSGSSANISASICNGSSYTFGTSTLTTAGTYTRHTTAANGCDSLITLTLIVKPNASANISASICNGSSYTFGTSTLTTGGTYTRHLTSANGCDSLITLTMIVKPNASANISASICNGSSYTFGASTLTTAGTYTRHLTSANGCDSLITLTLIVKPNASANISASICNGSSYTFGASTLTTAGTYTRHLTSANGCDSLITLTLIVKPNASANISASICNGSSYTFGASTLTTAGTYTRHLTSANGCDSLITLTLIVKPNASANISASICNGSSYTFGASTLTAAGTYTRNVTSANGCDSLITLVLNVRQNTSASINRSGCDNVSVNGTAYTSSGTYVQHLTNYAGCDSALTVNVIIKNSTASVVSVSGNDNVTVNGTIYTASGTYTQHLTNAAGCDSAVTVNVNIINSTSASINVSGCDNVTVNGTTYNTSGTYTQHLTNAGGADSALMINATITYSTASVLNVSDCGNVSVNGTTYTASGTYIQLLTNTAGCDSTLTINTTINNATSSVINVNGCNNVTVNGTVYNTTGTYIQTTTGITGCDSVITINVIILNPTAATLNIVDCNSTEVNGTTYSSSGTYLQTIPNAAGCDSVITLNIIINNSTSSSQNITACDSYLWNGTVYSASGTYAYSTVNAAGCDSTASLNLIINNSYNGVKNVQICAGGSYIFGGQTYTSTGSYLHTFQDINGCDSTVTLDLNLVDTIKVNLAASICNGATYTFGTQTLSAAGVYTDLVSSFAGCDSLTTLNLTVNDASSSVFNITSCNSALVNGTTYTASGTYNQTLVNAAGCDSLITLNVQINNSTGATIDVNGCDSVVVNGTTYTSGGTYTQMLTNMSGCDSVLTVNAAIIFSTAAVINVTGCDSVTVNENTYTLSGIYTQQMINSAGCDSIITVSVSIDALDLSVANIADTLFATQTNATYQWIDCADNTPIANATSQTFVATQIGNYAVVISNGSCSDTSACIAVVVTGNKWKSIASKLFAYPNPNNGTFVVKATTEGAYQVVNELGQIVRTLELNAANNYSAIVTDIAMGMYYVTGKDVAVQALKVVVTQ